MMQKDSDKNNWIIRAVKELNLPKDQYAVFGAGILDVLGIKETNDADLIVTEELFDHLKTSGEWTDKIFPDGFPGLYSENIEVFYTSGMPNCSQKELEEMIANSVDIQGIKFVQLTEILKWKKDFGRKKDLEVVPRIEKYINDRLEKIYNYLKINDKLPEKADAIVVGGAGTRTDMAERTAEIFHDGISDLIVVSGFKHPDFEENEAELLAKKLISLGVPKEKIIIEPNASNTAENLIFSAKKLSEKGAIPERIILVHRPFMTRRFKATAEAQWPNLQPKFYATSVNESLGKYLEREETDELKERTKKSILGDYKRISDYAEKGWQTPQPKSEEAENAFNELIKAGFKVR